MVANSGDCNILVFTPDGELLRSFGEKGKDPGEFLSPMGIAIARNGNYIISEKGNHRAQILKPNGEFVVEFGITEPKLATPVGIAVDYQTGNILVSNYRSNRIQLYDENGQFIKILIEAGRSLGSVNCPWNLALDREGKVVVCDLDNHRVQIFEPSGKYLMSFHLGEGRPCSVAIDPQGNLFVCDAGTREIKVYG